MEQSNGFLVVKIKDDSMLDAGIRKGERILFKKSKEFCSGDIVLARIPEGEIIRRFVSEDKPPYVYFKPENPKYDTILFEDGMRIIAKIVKRVKNQNN